jgi:DNA-binding protein HU-beta
MVSKKEIYVEVAQRTGITQKDAKVILDTMEDVVVEKMKQLEDVKVFNGVILSGVVKAAHEGRNPQTGEAIHIPEKVVPKAKFGAPIKTALNE